MAYGCFSDVLRFLALVLGLLCLVLLLVGFWLGGEQVAVWTLTTSPSTELNVNVWGPVPDLHVVVWWQDLARATNTRLGGVSVRAWIVSVTTGCGGSHAHPDVLNAACGTKKRGSHHRHNAGRPTDFGRNRWHRDV